ncbi:MAG: Hsp20 family protein [Limnobacter sp.]|nr:Hsp20 family protein [Limnobacter sp.]
MSTIDLTPLYRSSIGFDRMARLVDNALRQDTSTGYPPYNIEVVEENRYRISIAVAGFELNELDIEVENGVLTVKADKKEEGGKQFLHKGIAFRGFERKFNLADHVEVKGADLKNGLLDIELVKIIPEQMRPRKIHIGGQELKSVENKQDAA